ncbi:MAG TPA: hypothetical protein VIA11_07890 [Acidimicrobiia bacterium]|nr:hypothetical protein [Acidimicrobiia bacterium]
MIDRLLRAVIEAKEDAFAARGDVGDLYSGTDRDVAQTRPQPTRAGRSDRARREAVLQLAGHPVIRAGMRDEMTRERRPDVRRRVQHPVDGPRRVLPRAFRQPPNGRTANQDVDVRAAFVKQRRRLERALSTTDDRDSAAREHSELVMLERMRDALVVQSCEEGWLPRERADAGRDDDASRREGIVVDGDAKSGVDARDCSYVTVIDFGHGLLLEPLAVFDEPVDRNRTGDRST